MKKPFGFSFAVSVLALCIAGSALPMTGTQMQQIAQGGQHKVIVILRDQIEAAPPSRESMGARTFSIAQSQMSLINELQQRQARPVHSFRTINAFATSVTPAEEAQLAAHPEVQAVVADAIIHPPARQQRSQGSASSSAGPAPFDDGLCNTLEPQALQLTHAAYLDPSKPQAQQVIDGQGHRVIGSGVKVAFLADGLDPNVLGFIRPDGSHVFVDYQDFSGDPAGTPTGGGEAFGDASSIAAQDYPNGAPLLFDISKFVNAAHPLPSPCKIRIRGMAPGASLVGLKVFSNITGTPTSAFVQAIEYAVTIAQVDVINESFGGNPYPDLDNDPISLADKAAVRAGVTVVVSSGDAGTNGTIGSPATNPWVISAGASTQFRLYRQANEGAQALANGAISDNISSLSSGGFGQRKSRTVDVVAPGDLGWALCSTNTTLFTDCSDLESPPQPTPIQAFGGTSESSPLTAGEAALIIQAYRSTHGGKSPSPALVKRIIMSSATELGAVATEEGAGLIDALQAVQTALSVRDGNGKPNSPGGGLLMDTNSALVESWPNTHESRSFEVTNTGSSHRHLELSLRTLGPAVAGNTLNLNLNPASDPTFKNVTGSPRAYIKQTFWVPHGAEHLDAAIAWQVSLTSTATPIAYLALLDPAGRQAAYTLPQGVGSAYGHVDVVHPAEGQWTAVIYTRTANIADSYTGPVQFTWAAERYVTFGAVHPSTLDLAPGASAKITADFMMPSDPGDLAAAIRFDDPAQPITSGLPEIPITLRTLIPLGPTGGNFTGTLTGGNGRPGTGPTQTFEFDVPNGVDNMSLTLEIADNNYLLEGLLVDPNGMELSVEVNLDPFGDPQYALQLFRKNPQAGRWKFVLLLDNFSSGNQTSLPFTARIGFNNAQVSVTGLPTSPSTALSASGKPVTVTLQVTNSGAVTEAYFADARLNRLAPTPLPQQSCGPTSTGICAQYNVPTEVRTLFAAAQSNLPINMDTYNLTGFYYGLTGSPDIWARAAGSDTVLATLSEPEVPYGTWQTTPGFVGPFGPKGAPTNPISTAALAVMQPFDASMSASSGDIWADDTLGTNTFNPLVLAPGESGTITVTLTPDPSQVGQVVKGFIYIDTFNQFVSTGDEVVSIPYSYTVAK